MWAYCDTSAMAKRYVREPGRLQLTRVLERRRIVSSVLMPVELHSAFSRRVREGALATIHQPRLFERMDADQRHWTLIEVTSGILACAQELIERYPLRTLDAIHLASAHIFAERLGSSITFISADARQIAAAGHMGLATRAITR